MMSIRSDINWENESSGNEADCESDFDNERTSSHRVTSRRCSIGKSINKPRSFVANEETTVKSCTSGTNVSGKKTVHKVVASLIDSARCTLTSTSEEERVSKKEASLLTVPVANVLNDNISDSSCYSSCSDTEIDSESDGQRKPGDPCNLKTLNSECIAKLQAMTTEDQTSDAIPMDIEEVADYMSGKKRIKNIVN